MRLEIRLAIVTLVAGVAAAVLAVLGAGLLVAVVRRADAEEAGEGGGFGAIAGAALALQALTRTDLAIGSLDLARLAEGLGPVLIVLVAVLTWVVPSGEFERRALEDLFSSL